VIPNQDPSFAPCNRCRSALASETVLNKLREDNKLAVELYVARFWGFSHEDIGQGQVFFFFFFLRHMKVTLHMPQPSNVTVAQRALERVEDHSL
jgi:hypothetical protein